MEKKYTQTKNEENPIKIINEEELPETKAIVNVNEFIRPLVSIEQAKDAYEKYLQLTNALVKEGDLVNIQGKKVIKKSGMNKITRFFAISVEVIKVKEEEKDGILVFKVWAKAIAPNGQFRVSGGACSSNERRFAHPYHDILATAETRAKKRAIEELVGMGDYELSEDSSDYKEKYPLATDEQLHKIKELLEITNSNLPKFIDWLVKTFNKETIEELSVSEADEIIKKLGTKMN